MANETLLSVPPGALGAVRIASHSAVQWPSRAARANLVGRPDDSHSNLGWNDHAQALVSHPLDEDGQLQLGFSFETGALVALTDARVTASLELVDADESAAERWCEKQLRATGLESTARAVMPYELPPADYAALADEAGRQALGTWYSKGHRALTKLIERYAGRAVEAPVLRCWPHHFDLGALFFLEEGDPETARSIGVGLSPGDESYAEPYFYCTPWPAPPALPAAPAPFTWHTSGFTSLVLTASSINAATDVDAAYAAAFSIAADTLGLFS